MQSEEELSPEEKLLKVIQGKPGNVPHPPRQSSPPTAPGTRTAATAGTIPPGPSPVSKPPVQLDAKSAGSATRTGTVPPVTGAKAAVPPVAATKSAESVTRPAPAAPVVEAKAASVPVKSAEPPTSVRTKTQPVKQAEPVAPERKLTLQPKPAEAKPAEAKHQAKPLGTVTAAVQPEAPQPGIRARARTGAGSSLRLINRVMGVAAVLLFVVVVLELLAAKPVLPKPLQNAGSPVQFPGAIVQPHPETNYVPASRHLFGDLNAAVVEVVPLTNKVAKGAVSQITSYLAENVKLEGVSLSDAANQTFVAVTEKGITRYLRIGAELTVPVDGKQEKIVLDRIVKDEVYFQYGDKSIPLKGK